MRTTIDLDEDVEAAVLALQRELGIGRSKALNELARRGAARRSAREPYRVRPVALGAKLDLSNIGEVLDLLDAEPS